MQGLLEYELWVGVYIKFYSAQNHFLSRFWFPNPEDPTCWYVNIHIYTYMYTYMCIYIYIHTYRNVASMEVGEVDGVHGLWDPQLKPGSGRQEVF